MASFHPLLAIACCNHHKQIRTITGTTVRLFSSLTAFLYGGSQYLSATAIPSQEERMEWSDAAYYKMKIASAKIH
jgi:uncharacterized protein YchJ